MTFFIPLVLLRGDERMMRKGPAGIQPAGPRRGMRLFDGLDACHEILHLRIRDELVIDRLHRCGKFLLVDGDDLDTT
jgi:hypothetical protein